MFPCWLWNVEYGLVWMIWSGNGSKKPKGMVGSRNLLYLCEAVALLGKCPGRGTCMHCVVAVVASFQGPT